ncbi:MAG: hypothetical protein M1818_008527 [Claussenomyces sp. TS43310]|nr:MAG: hypothetical protein M1818_008527 [Claussenomyces sp. TS43310]
MVLENTSDKISDSFTEDAPASDADPYASSQAGSSEARSIPIDVSNFPKPMPLFGPLSGFTNQFLSRMIQARIQASTHVLKRPITEDEASAIAFWTAKQLSITSYGTPLGVGGATWRAYASRKSFRFPFYQPDLASFNANAWPATKRTILSGLRATSAWHATRFLAYGIVGNYVGQVLLTSYAMSVVTVGELGDPRLKDYVKGLRENAKHNVERGRRGSPTPLLPPKGSPDTLDDASPTGSAYGDAAPEAEALGDQEMQTQEARQRPHPRSSPTKNNATTFQMDKTAPQPQSFDQDFDDASPTGGQGTYLDTESSSGSAWDRIRHQASAPTESNSGSSSSWPAGRGQAQASSRGGWINARKNAQKETQSPSTSDDPFAFSNSEEDKQLAREEAQKEFDARVERERKGGDFSGDQKRW